SGGTVTKGGGTAHDVLKVIGGSATINWQGSLTESTTAFALNVTATNTGNITFSTGTVTAGAGSSALSFAAANGTYTSSRPVSCRGRVHGLVIGTSPGTLDFSPSVAI